LGTLHLPTEILKGILKVGRGVVSEVIVMAVGIL
jgi:hypothetical protein